MELTKLVVVQWLVAQVKPVVVGKNVMLLKTGIVVMFNVVNAKMKIVMKSKQLVEEKLVEFIKLVRLVVQVKDLVVAKRTVVAVVKTAVVVVKTAHLVMDASNYKVIMRAMMAMMILLIMTLVMVAATEVITQDVMVQARVL